MIIRVFDKKEGLLISLLSLLQLLTAKVPGFRSMIWEIIRARSGYGENICDLEDQLDVSDGVHISIDDLISWLESGEYFVAAKLVSASNDLSFGVEDSTYLYMESEDDRLIEEVKAAYEETEVLCA